jgi:phage terminase large subunit GpA-like protein
MLPQYKPMLSSFLDGIKPSEKLSVEEHSRRHFYLPRDGNPFPGHFDVNLTPYLREILSSLEFENPAEEIVFMKGCQIGGSSVSLAFLLWVANCGHSAPSLVVFPTEKNAHRFVKKKFRPAVQNCAPLMEKLAQKDVERESLDLFSYPGGTVSFGNAHAPNTMRMDSCAVVIFDEVSDFPTDSDGQGDPIEIGRGRTSTYEGRRKIYLVSTPTISGICRIEKAYLETDQRKFFVPCPECEYFQLIDWKRIRWDQTNSEKVWLECENSQCKIRIFENKKTQMLAKGQWRATASAQGRKIGFHISGLYAPVGMLSWRAAVGQFLAAKESPSLLKVFVNNILGETWKEGVGFSKNRLKKRIHDYRVEPLPQGVGLVTAGVDINGSHTNIEIVGWGRDRENWGLAYHIIEKEPSDPDLWQELDLYLNQIFTHHKGFKLRIAATAIDTGFMCDEVYAYVRSKLGSGRNIIGIKGIEGLARPVIESRPNFKNKGRLPIYSVSMNTSNDLLFAWLNTKEPGPGFCHFPKFYKKTNFFDELSAVKRITEYRKGRELGRWVQEPSKRKEANDCRRYAMAAMFHLGALGEDINLLCDRLDSGQLEEDEEYE